MWRNYMPQADCLFRIRHGEQRASDWNARGGVQRGVFPLARCVASRSFLRSAARSARMK